jgi:hypothetical protein
VIALQRVLQDLPLVKQVIKQAKHISINALLGQLKGCTTLCVEEPAPPESVLVSEEVDGDGGVGGAKGTCP